MYESINTNHTTLYESKTNLVWAGHKLLLLFKGLHCAMNWVLLLTAQLDIISRVYTSPTHATS